MKKFLVTMVLGLLVCGLVQAESSLSKCKGKIVSKWSNCHGTRESLFGHKYVGTVLVADGLRGHRRTDSVCLSRYGYTRCPPLNPSPEP